MKTPHPAWAWILIALGLYPVLLGLGVLPVSPEQIHAPAWVVVLAGMVFILCGVMLFVGRGSRLAPLFAGTLCACFSAIGFWVAIWGRSEHFSGGIPLLSNTANVGLARWMFGGGALISLALSIAAFREFIVGGQEQSGG